MPTAQQTATIERVASLVGTRPEWLDALINFETGGTYSTTIKNPVSSARGLIQIIDAAARDIGYKDSLDAVTRNNDFDSQMMNVVLPYLRMQQRRYTGGGSLDTKQKLYMAVFYPAYMDNPPDTAFSSNIKKVNPGIDTVQDYINYVDAKVNNVPYIKGAGPSKILPLLLIAAVAAGVYLMKKKS